MYGTPCILINIEVLAEGPECIIEVVE